MDILEAKNLVVKAGIMLCNEGLIQRTWGNVSCRIDENSFVITPSGRDYMSLTPDDIVLVNIADLSYDGEIKPSSEKGVHAVCYSLRPDVSFVIHTHQTFASLIGMAGRDISGIDGKPAEIIGREVPLATYGLPGTGKLKDGVFAAIERTDSKAVLMHHHGAVCLGSDLDDAFNVARELEALSKSVILTRFTELTGQIAGDVSSIFEYISAKLGQSAEPAQDLPVFNSKKEFSTIEVFPADGSGETYRFDAETLEPLEDGLVYPVSADLHLAVYKKRKDVGAVIHSKDSATLEASRSGKKVLPYLDDFAQIVGTSLKNAGVCKKTGLPDVCKMTRALKFRDAVMLKDNGALCVGKDGDEAEAVRLVAEKGCEAAAVACLWGKEKESLSFGESLLMRVIYKVKYSKKK